VRHALDEPDLVERVAEEAAVPATNAAAATRPAARVNRTALKARGSKSRIAALMTMKLTPHTTTMKTSRASVPVKPAGAAPRTAAGAAAEAGSLTVVEK
jgi:hypothetical protein